MGTALGKPSDACHLSQQVYLVVGGGYCGSFADCLDMAKVWAGGQMLMTPAFQALP